MLLTEGRQILCADSSTSVSNRVVTVCFDRNVTMRRRGEASNGTSMGRKDVPADNNENDPVDKWVRRGHDEMEEGAKYM